MALRLIHNNKFEANRWLITARWFYAPAIFIMGLLSKLDPVGTNTFPIPSMLFIFSVFTLTNLLFWIAVKKLEIANNTDKINLLGVGQILAELVFFALILHLAGGVESASPIFFFIPIVSSIILFSPIGSIFISFVSGLIIHAYIFLQYYGIIQILPGYTGEEIIEYSEFLKQLSTTVIITAVYFIVGALAGYLSSVLKKRELQLIESKRQSQLQTDKLRLLNEEYNNFARKLVRKDLELQQENQKIAKLDLEKTEFVSTVAHQLRTPLSAIKWTLDILLQGGSGELNNDQKTLLMKAYESNERIINLIQDMLGVEKAEFKADSFSPVEINLPDVVKNVLPDFRSLVENKSIRIEMQSEKNLPKVMVDPQKIRAVFQNLIENAIKYSKPGGWIKIIMKKENDKNVLISVEDNGIGIPKHEQQNIFKKFFRAQNASKKEPNGTGLGLFIIRSIIERHKGTITFESEENKGTRFDIRIPIVN